MIPPLVQEGRCPEARDRKDLLEGFAFRTDGGSPVILLFQVSSPGQP